MSRFLLSIFIATFVTLTTLSANCGMHSEDMKNCNCKVKVEKPACACKVEKGSCDCKPKCNCSEKPSKMKKEHCSIDSKSIKHDAKKCGCGMSIQSCKDMMPHCKYRDAREAKEALKK